MRVLMMVMALAALVTTDCSGGSPAGDAGCETPSRLTARASCGWVGVIYQARLGDDPGACPQVACPFPFDSSAREIWTCDPTAIERCTWALESRANECADYRDVMEAECAEAAATCYAE